MVNYKNTKIYYIQVGEERYYGHTAKYYMSERESNHKYKFKKGYVYPLYEKMREIGMNVNDIKCVWVEDWPCENVNQAKSRERWWIEQYGNLNRQVPLRTDQEYYKDNKKAIDKRIKDYRSRNIERTKHRIAEYKKNNIDKIRQNKLEYYEKNKERISAYQKEYYQNNKEKICERTKQYGKEYKKLKGNCEICGKEMLKASLKRHNREVHGEENLHI